MVDVAPARAFLRQTEVGTQLRPGRAIAARAIDEPALEGIQCAARASELNESAPRRARPKIESAEEGHLTIVGADGLERKAPFPTRPASPQPR